MLTRAGVRDEDFSIMTIENAVAAHYTTGSLTARIIDALRAQGIDPDRARPDDLGAVGEFHIGGVAATRELVGRLAPGPKDTVLDIGSGLGGTARHIAGSAGCSVTGLDLTPEFVETARALSAMVGMAGTTRFEIGSATAMPFADRSFDAATLLHVGMNIPDKGALMAEAARVLRPGSTFAIYEVMRTGPGDLAYPVPWAEGPETSFLGSPEDYRAAAEAAGFRVGHVRDRRAFALDFFHELQRRASAGGAPALGVQLVMAGNRAAKVANMIANIEDGLIAPVEMFLHIPDSEV